MCIRDSINTYPRINAETKKGISWTIGVFFGKKEIPIHETPNISAMLDMFDPTTAPIAMLSLLFKTEEIPTNISGAEVPNATIVNPIVNSLTPIFFAIKDELSTNLSAPQINTAKEATKPIKLIRNSIIHFTLVINRDYVSLSKIQYNLVINL